jgi:putative membrane protein
MEIAIDSFVKGFPQFMLHGGVTLSLLIAGCIVHVLLTPMKELKLIREGNISAGISVGAIIVGLSVYDILIWGVVAILLQLLAFRAADLLLRDLPRRIERDEIGSALVLAAVKIAAAIVMASAL